MPTCRNSDITNQRWRGKAKLCCQIAHTDPAAGFVICFDSSWVVIDVETAVAPVKLKAAQRADEDLAAFDADHLK